MILQAAFESIKGVPDTIGEPRFFAYRASLLLAVGRVDEASKDIERALSLSPNYSDALALQSIIAVVQNEREKALDLARKAVAADPKSAAALIALSYAQQANFDLEGALDSLKQAVQVNPNNALAWARLSELHLSFARLDEALEAAQRAVALDPNLARTQMVLGFAYLTQVNTTESKRAFERSIELDQADSLSRLGLGLAKIREGDLAEGRREIEIAASLDPNNSIVRSYLGKAYFEEKRTTLDEREYAIAKELDPNDPTPCFYDAIAKQTTNRPVEALQNMQKAIELNDNRAVYRSRLLLDSDLAARSAALGQIYNDLGFQQLGLVEGWKSVNTDPTNFSAHRFLADSYSNLPRHEIARVSELFKSQLLQPINITPIQPRLAESNLFLDQRWRTCASLLQRVQSAVQPKWDLRSRRPALAVKITRMVEKVSSLEFTKRHPSALVGFTFRQMGFEKTLTRTMTLVPPLSNSNSLHKQAFKVSIDTGTRYEAIFDSDSSQMTVFPGETIEEETQTARVGLRHAFSPNSIILGSFIYQDANFSLRENEVPQPFFTFTDAKRPESSFSTEFQHLFRSQYFNLTSGVGYAKSDGKVDITVGTILPPPFDIISLPRASTDLKHTNVYTYSYINLLRNVTFTLGASGDFANSDSPEFKSKRQFNPKFGITWNPYSSHDASRRCIQGSEEKVHHEPNP